MAYVLVLLIVLGIPVVAIVIIFDRIRQLTARITRLEWELKDALRAQAVIDRAAPHAHPAAPISEMTEIVETPAERSAIPVPPPVTPPPIRVERSPLPEAPPSRTRQEWEAIIGGKLLNRIGALALILGAGFFLKYAFDNDWISEPVRVLIGVAVGVFLLYFGARTHRKGLAVFAQGIQGAGIAILYLAVYASYGYYHLVPHIVAFAGMGVVTLAAFLVGLRFESQATALLGWLGGYLTPIILATDEANLVGLSLYLTILAGGMVTLQIRRPDWKALIPLSEAANGIVFVAGWLSTTPSHGEMLFGYGILIAMWCIYALPAITHYRAGRANDPARRAADILNTLIVIACMCTLRFQFGLHVQAGIALCTIAALTAGTFAYLERLNINSHAMRVQYSALSVLAIAAAIKLGIGSAQWEITVMSVAAVPFVLVGTRKQITELWQSGCLLLLPVAWLMVVSPETFKFEPIAEFHLIWHLRTLTFLVPAGAIMVIIAMLRRIEGQRSISSQTVLHVGWVALLFLFFTVEVNDYFRFLLTRHGEIVLSAANLYTHNLILSATWMILAVSVVVLGTRRSILPLVFTGACVGAASTLFGIVTMIGYDPIAQFTLFANVRFATAIFLLIGIYLVSRELRRLEHPTAVLAADIAGISLALIPVIVFSAEAWAAFGRNLYENLHDGDTLTQIKNQRQLVLSGIWLIYSLILIAVGILKRHQPMRLMAIGLFALAILKIFIYDLSFLQTLYRIFSFVGLGLILLVVSYVYQRYREIIFGSPQSKSPEQETAGKT